MCTVSFVSAGNKKIITSNRDEHIHRETAAAPRTEIINGRRLIFPKDARAGGTWFAASESGVVSVLLNGAFEKHTPNPPYRQSRGLILLDIIAAGDPLHSFTEIDLQDIEPFTVVHYLPGRLFELRWDGDRRHEKELDVSGNHIWSSATLYNREVVAYRKQLFERFLENTASPLPWDVHGFHANNNNDEENGFVISRKTGLKTFSITQAVWQQDKIDFMHTDLLHDKRFEEAMQIRHALVNLS